MTSRLRRNRQAMVLQQRSLVSSNELFEMMRSRQVYYVQNELRKDLDRTLRALKQAEKMKLAGFRIQKAIFLKRKNIFDMRARRLTNSLAAAKNNNVILNQAHPSSRGCSHVVEIKHRSRESSTIIQGNYVPMSSQTHGGDRIPTLHSDHRVGSAGISASRGRPLGKSDEGTHIALSESTVNSEWMCNIQQGLQQSNINTDKTADNLLLLQDHSEDKQHRGEILKQQSGDQYSQTTNKSILSSNNSKNTSQKNNELSNRQHTLLNTRGEYKIYKNYREDKQNDETIRLYSTQEVRVGKYDAKLRSSEPTAVHTYLGNVRESGDKKKKHAQLGELSVINGMEALSLNSRSNKLRLHHQLHKSDQRVVETDPKARHNDLPHQTKQIPSQHTMSQKDVVVHHMKPTIDRRELALGAENVQRSFVMDSTAKQIQLNLIEESNLTNHVHKETLSKQANTAGSFTQKQLLLQPGMAYLDRSKRHPPDKLSVLLADRDSRNSRSSPASLERTVTMIFVEDSSVSTQDPPKSQFDFEAWLAYNKRKRGYTQIFDEKASPVTSDDASTRTSTTLENKRSAKSRVRFDFPKRLTLSTPIKPDMLTFREKSKEWYLNFLKRNKRYPEANRQVTRNIQVRQYVSNKSNYALLPNISLGPDYSVGEYSSSKRNSLDTFDIDTNNALSSESTDEKLQRLKDYSKRLQVKVHDFVYS